MELKDYYFILRVPRTATARDILRAYRTLAKLYHPDRVGEQGTSAFQDIVEAYEVLSDPERRRHYNHSLSEFIDTPSPAPPRDSAPLRPEPLIPEQQHFRLYRQPPPLVPEPISLLHDFGTVSPSFDALYDRFLQNFIPGSRPQSDRLDSLTAEIRLSPYEALQGVVVPIGIPVFVRCVVCGGSGRDWFSACLACRGQGLVETEQTVHVHIPAQVQDGTVFEIPLQSLGVHNFYLRLHIRVAW